MDKNSKDYFENLVSGNKKDQPDLPEEEEEIIDQEIDPADAPIANVVSVDELEKVKISKPKSKSKKMKTKEETKKEKKEDKDESEKITLKEVPDETDFFSDSFLGEAEGQLTVDVYQTDDDIIIQSTVAGVTPEDLSIDITSESVSIKGQRKRNEEVKDDNFFYQECYWGRFSRSVILPQEIDPDKSEAELKDGILTIRLRKINRDKAKRVKIKLS